MNPAELTISPFQTKTAPAPGSSASGSGSAQKNGMPGGKSQSQSQSQSQYERVNVEPIYKQLQKLLGKDWETYRAALRDYAIGQISQAELSWHVQPIFVAAAAACAALPAPPSGEPSYRTPAAIIALHNSFIISVYANITRDPPSTDVAPWVVAADKPAVTAKSAGTGSGTNDKTEERLKAEVMQLHARDRKRIKLSKEPAHPVNDGLQDMQDYHNELAIRQAQQAQQADPQNATGTGPSGLAKTNWDVEIRRRYAQPLASEMLEFPSHNEIQARIEPICYEEGLTNGVQQGAMSACTDLVEQATEVYVKELIGSLLSSVRSNAVGGRGGIQTAKFQRQLRKEEEEAELGIIQRTAGGLLPVEVESQQNQKPVSMQDLSLAVGLKNGFFRRDKFLEERIMLNRYPVELQSDVTGGANGGAFAIMMKNGPGPLNDDGADDDAMAVDDNEYGGWKGADEASFLAGMSALDDFLLSSDR